jgi:succinylglutamate desuccinylase
LDNRSGKSQWSQISGLQLIISALDVTTYILYDGDFGFLNGPFTGTAEDSASQNAYGLRELTETDEELTTDNECYLRAKALLDYLKAPEEYLKVRTTVLDYGNTPLLAADKIHVTLPNENVDGDFRIETVEYYVDAKTQTLEVTLELGKVPPLLADYLYGLRATTVTLEKLARTKLGRR